jgi:hypothetical protein
MDVAVDSQGMLMAARSYTSNRSAVYQWPRCGCDWVADTHPPSEYQSNWDTHRVNLPESPEKQWVFSRYLGPSPRLLNLLS